MMQFKTEMIPFYDMNNLILNRCDLEQKIVQICELIS